MIDILSAKKEFKNYVENYNSEDKKIALKIAHMERVSQMSKKIAKSLKLEKEDIELAELIGLLHDIGRLEQIKQYNTFIDRESINHGEFGVKILFEEGKIRDFISTSKYDEIIKKAILNHNKKKIEEGLSRREMLHSKIIRDADKIDIFYIMTFDKLETIYESKNLTEEKITDEIFREFMEDRKIDYSKNQNSADIVVANFAYVYDLYFNYSLKYIYESQYLEKFYKRLIFSDKETMKRYNLVYETSRKYIKKQLIQKDD